MTKYLSIYAFGIVFGSVTLSYASEIGPLNNSSMELPPSINMVLPPVDYDNLSVGPSVPLPTVITSLQNNIIYKQLKQKLTDEKSKEPVLEEPLNPYEQSLIELSLDQRLLVEEFMQAVKEWKKTPPDEIAFLYLAQQRDNLAKKLNAKFTEPNELNTFVVKHDDQPPLHAPYLAELGYMYSVEKKFLITPKGLRFDYGPKPTLASGVDNFFNGIPSLGKKLAPKVLWHLPKVGLPSMGIAGALLGEVLYKSYKEGVYPHQLVKQRSDRVLAWLKEKTTELSSFDTKHPTKLPLPLEDSDQESSEDNLDEVLPPIDSSNADGE